MKISLETKVQDILDNKAALDICNSVSGNLFSSPMLASAGTMNLQRIAGFMGKNGEAVIGGIIEKANALLKDVPDTATVADNSLKNLLPLSSKEPKNITVNNSIKPGRVWCDTEGKRIQAHGACVYFENGVYYWIGENKDYTTKEGKVWTWGVKIYSSVDLYNWKDEGYLIEPDLENKLSVFYPVRRLDRPHVLYNDKTKKYVLWLKYCDEAHYAVLTSDSLKGKYEIVKEVYRPFGVNCGDFDLAKDEKTGQGYLYFEVNHTDVWAVKLSEDYTEVEGEYSVIYKDMNPPYAREAVTHMCRNGKHYIFTSGMTGYVPNPSEVAMSDDWLSGYKVLGNPHINDKSSASFNSQFSCIFKIAGKDKFIAVADRWVPDCVMTAKKYDVLERSINSRTDKTVTVTLEEKKQLAELPLMGTANTSVATYIWLPVSFNGDTPEIYWHDEWQV